MTLDRSEYVATIEQSLETLYRPEHEAFWEGEFRDDEWGGRHRIVQDFAFLYAVLDEFTDNETYRERAERYLLEFGRGDHFASILCGNAYELLAPGLAPDQREAFASDWTSEAGDALDTYVDRLSNLDDLEHVPNHAIAACFYADYARSLFPEEAAPYGYEKRTDPVWEAWWERREFHEQASNYEGFTETILLCWAALRGHETDLYSTPSVRNMLERKLSVLSSGEIVAPYGDTSYHQHQCKWITLFERIAADRDDGRFRSAATDAFSYFREEILPRFSETLTDLDEDSLYNARLIFKNHLHEVAWLGLAALFHDRSVTSAARPDPAGRIRRLPYGYTLDETDEGRLPGDALVDGQVALTGGDPDAQTYLLLSVGPELVHDHADAGAIHLLSRDRTVFLGTNGYLQRELPYHNAFYAQPVDWERYPEDDHDRVLTGDGDCRGRIEELVLRERSSRCRVRFDGYHGLPIDLTREVVVDAAGRVTLIDRARTGEAGYCAGPLFHAEEIEELDDHAYRLRTDTLRSLGGIETENPPGELRVRVSAPGASAAVPELGLPPIYEESYREFPTTHYKRVWRRSYATRRCLGVRRELTPDETATFVTRLNPRVPDERR